MKPFSYSSKFLFLNLGLLRRLAEFRALNTEDETVLNYFDELEIHPDNIGIKIN